MLFHDGLFFTDLGSSEGAFVRRPQPGPAVGQSGKSVCLAYGFSGQVTFMVAPLSFCDLTEFDLETCM